MLSFGPFLIFCPMKPIIVKQKALKKIVEGVQRKETRYFAFALFCLVTLMQGFVGYSLYNVLTSSNNKLKGWKTKWLTKSNHKVVLISIEQVIFCLVAYTLIVLYYLIAFYDAMMKKPIVIKGVNLLDEVCSLSFFFFGWIQIWNFGVLDSLSFDYFLEENSNRSIATSPLCQIIHFTVHFCIVGFLWHNWLCTLCRDFNFWRCIL